MKILFISDIHGIKKNLNYIKKLDDKESFDKIVALGELYYSGPNFDKSYEVDSAYVKEFLTSYKERLLCMRGNCDSDVDIKSSDFPICEGLSLISVDNLDIYITHGNIYNIENSEKLNKNNILVHGHFHIPFIETKDNITYINTGSISLPKGMNIASYLIYEDKEFKIFNVEGSLINSISFK